MGEEGTGSEGIAESGSVAAEPTDASQVQAAKKITQALAKTVSLQRLYAKRNEIVKRSLTDLTEAFEAYIGRHGTLRIQVESLEFRLGRESIQKDLKREDSIPHRLYRDGIRELVFLEGLTAEEVEDFVEILRKESGEGGMGEEDLVSLLWKKDFSSIDYMAIDDISDQAAPEGEEEDADGGPAEAGKKERRADPRGESTYRLHAPGMSLEELIPSLDARAASGPGLSGSYKLSLGFVDLDDPIFRGPAGESASGPAAKGPGATAKSDAELFLDVRSVPVRDLAEDSRAASLTSLYQLTQADRDKIRAEIDAEDPGRLCSMVCDIVFEMFESGAGTIPEESFAQILTPMLNGMLARGDFGAINSTLAGLERTAGGGFGTGAATREKVTAALASPENIRIALRVLDAEPRGKGRGFLAYLDKLSRTSIEPLIAGYGEVRGREAGALVRDFVLTRARRDPALMQLLLDSEHDDLVEGVLAFLKSPGDPEAFALLSKTVTHGNPSVRLRSLKMLSTVEGAQMGDLLVGLVGDSVAEIRLLALKLLAGQPAPRVTPKLLEHIGSADFEELPLQERTAFYQALASCGGDSAVSFLEERLRKKSWFSRGKTGEDRRLAALALGNIATPAAIAALERGASCRDNAIRGTCDRALKHARRGAG